MDWAIDFSRVIFSLAFLTTRACSFQSTVRVNSLDLYARIKFKLIHLPFCEKNSNRRRLHHLRFRSFGVVLILMPLRLEACGT